MMLLPKKIGAYTLTRRLGSDGVVEAFVAILDEPAGKQVVVKRLLPWVTRDSARVLATEARIGDLTGNRHPLLASVLDYVKIDGEHLIIEDWHEGVTLDAVIQWCRIQKKPVPHAIFLHWATQICNGLEALHARPGKSTGAEHVLHLGLEPASILLGPDGKVLLGGFSYFRSPAIPQDPAADPDPNELALLVQNPPRLEYLAPEQTYSDQKLSPSSDLFGLGALLFEVLTTESMFAGDSIIQTLHKVRRAEVAGPLARSKELLPGLDKVLYRALSLNPRHRYQRAFVLREDLRGLMAGFSFAKIADDIQAFLAPLVEQRGRPEFRSGHTLTPVDEPSVSFDDDGPHEDTAALIRRAQDKRDPDGYIPSPINPAPPPEVKQSQHTWYDDGGEHTAPLPDPESQEETTNTTWLPNPAIEANRAAASPKVEQPSGTPAAQVQPLTPAPAEPPTDKVGTKPTPEPEKAAPPEPKPNATARMPIPAPEPKPNATAQMATPLTKKAASPAIYEMEEPPPKSNMGWLIGAAVVGVVAVVAVVVCAGGGLAGVQSLLNGSAQEASSVPVATPDLPAEPKVDEAPKEIVADTAAPTTPAAEPASPQNGRTPPETVAKVEPEPKIAEPRPEPKTKAEPAPKADPTPKADSTPKPERPAPAKEAPKERSPVVIEEKRPAKAEPKPTHNDSIAIVTPPTPTVKSPSKTAKSIPIQVFDIAPPEVAPEAVIAVEPTLGPLADYSERAFKGTLSESDRKLLEGIEKGHEDYTRAEVLLYQDAKARGDRSARKKYLDAVMSVPENQYNPALLSEQGQLAIERKDWKTAVAKADLAERHWQRLPSELIFTRKAMIYELQAAGWQGVFYDSGGADLPALQASIRAWEKYQRHVSPKSRDLSAKAEDELTKLYDVQRRLE